MGQSGNSTIDHLGDVGSSQLTLRIQRPDGRRRTVRFTGRACAIGSGDGCQVRLEANGIAPTQCLILCGPAGMAIRNWRPQTLLNGAAFQDAPLVTGDRIDVGPFRIDVLKWRAEAPVDGAERPARDARVGRGRKSASGRQRPSRKAELDRQALRLARREQTLAERVARIKAKSRSLAKQRREFEQAWDSRHTGLCAERADLDRRWQELEATRASVSARQTRLEQEVAEAHATLRQTEDLERKAAEAALVAERDEVVRALREWQIAQVEAERASDARHAVEREALSARLAECQDLLSKAVTELSAERRSAEARRAADVELRQATELRLDQERREHEAALDAQRAEFESQRRELETLRMALQNERSALETERGLLATERRSHDADLAAARSEFSGQQARLKEETERLAAERLALAQLVEEQRSQHEAALAAISQQRAALEKLTGDHNDAAQLWWQRNSEFDQAEADFRQRQEAWRLECELAEQALQEREREIHELRASLDARQNEARAQNEAIDQQQSAVLAERDAWRAERASIEAERHTLEVETTELRRAREAWAIEHAKWQSEKAESEKAELDRRQLQLQAESTSQDATQRELDRQAELRQRDIELHQAEVERQRRELDALREQLERQRADALVEQLSWQAEREQSHADRTARETAWEQRESQLLAQLAAMEAHDAERDSGARAAQTQWQDASAANEALRLELAAARQEIEAARRELDAARLETDAARRQAEVARQDAEAASLEAERLRAESFAAESRLSELHALGTEPPVATESEPTATDHDAPERLAEIERREKELSEVMERLIAEQAAASAALEQRVAAFEAEQARAREQASAAQAEYDAWRLERDKQQATLADESLRLAQLQQTLEPVREAVDAGREQLEAARCEHDAERRQLESERAQLAAECERLARDRDRLVAEQEQLVAEQRQLAEETDLASNERRLLVEERQRLDARQEQLAADACAASGSRSVESDFAEPSHTAALDDDVLASRGAARPDAVSDDDIFARLRSLSLLKDSDGEQQADLSTGDRTISKAHDSLTPAGFGADASRRAPGFETADHAFETVADSLPASDAFAFEDDAADRGDEHAQIETTDAGDADGEPAACAPEAEPDSSVSEYRMANAGSSDSSEEESIEDYMARLLNRVRGGVAKEPAGGKSPAPAPKPDVERATPSTAPSPPRDVSLPAAPAPVALQPPAADEKPGESSTSSKAERILNLPRSGASDGVDLSKMRDFANDQARAAIHTYRRQTSQRNANTKWLLAACALVSASSVWWFSGGDDATMRMAAAAGVVITIFWTWQAVLLTRRVLKLKTSQVSSDPAPSSRDR